MAAMKAITPDLDPLKYRVDHANGRVFYDRKLVAEREHPDAAPAPRLETFQTLAPTATNETIQTALAQVVADKEKAHKDG